MKELFAEIDAVEKRLRDSVESHIEGILRANPDIPAFGIYGYTPSFNDGDPCTFTSGDLLEDLEWRFEEYKDEEEERVDMIRCAYNLSQIAAEALVSTFDSTRDEATRKKYYKLMDDLFNSKIYGFWSSRFSEYGFAAVYYLKDDKLAVSDGDYDCGY